MQPSNGGSYVIKLVIVTPLLLSCLGLVPSATSKHTSLNDGRKSFGSLMKKPYWIKMFQHIPKIPTFHIGSIAFGKQHDDSNENRKVHKSFAKNRSKRESAKENQYTDSDEVLIPEKIPKGRVLPGTTLKVDKIPIHFARRKRATSKKSLGKPSTKAILAEAETAVKGAKSAAARATSAANSASEFAKEAMEAADEAKRYVEELKVAYERLDRVKSMRRSKGKDDLEDFEVSGRTFTSSEELEPTTELLTEDKDAEEPENKEVASVDSLLKETNVVASPEPVSEEETDSKPSKIPKIDETLSEIPKIDETPSEISKDDENPVEIPKIDETPSEIPKVDENVTKKSKIDETPAEIPEIDETPSEILNLDENLTENTKIGKNPLEIAKIDTNIKEMPKLDSENSIPIDDSSNFSPALTTEPSNIKSNDSSAASKSPKTLPITPNPATNVQREPEEVSEDNGSIKPSTLTKPSSNKKLKEIPQNSIDNSVKKSGSQSLSAPTKPSARKSSVDKNKKPSKPSSGDPKPTTSATSNPRKPAGTLKATKKNAKTSNLPLAGRTEEEDISDPDSSSLTSNSGEIIEENPQTNAPSPKSKNPKGELVSNAKAKEGQSLAISLSKMGADATATAVNGTGATSLSSTKGRGKATSRSNSFGKEGAKSQSQATGRGNATSHSLAQGQEGDSDSHSLAVGGHALADSTSLLGSKAKSNAQTLKKGDATSNSISLTGNASASSIAKGKGNAKSNARVNDGGTAKSLSKTKGGNSTANSMGLRDSHTLSIASSKKNGSALANALTGIRGTARSDALTKAGDAVAVTLQDSPKETMNISTFITESLMKKTNLFNWKSSEEADIEEENSEEESTDARKKRHINY